MTQFTRVAAWRRASPILSVAFLCTAMPQAHSDTTSPSILWKGLVAGMTPEEALPIVQQIAGVKRAKLLKERKSNPERRIDIDFAPDKIAIADLPFELGLSFAGGRLNQVLLAARDQCGADAALISEQLTAGLGSKYDAALPVPQLSDLDFRQAERAARTSGEPSDVTTAFASDSVAVVLTFRMTVEAPPPYPTSYSKLGHALWALANTQHGHRKAECRGTGDRRMDIVLVYMKRAAFDAVAAQIEAEAAEKAAQTARQF